MDGDWTVKWQRAKPLPDELVAWMRGLPEAVQATMLRFPPCCLVRARVPLVCPRPGEAGFVRSYFEDGTVSVEQPDNPVRGQCAADDLEVVGYCAGLTPGVVARVLAGGAP